MHTMSDLEPNWFVSDDEPIEKIPETSNHNKHKPKSEGPGNWKTNKPVKKTIADTVNRKHNIVRNSPSLRETV